MRLILLSEWAEQTFAEASRPSLNTLYRWIHQGRFPKDAIKRYGARYFVDLDKVEATDGKVSELVKKALGDESQAA